jgi:hypothetical protein
MILVLKRHTYNFFALARRDTEQLPLSSAKPVPATRSSDVANNDFRGSLADAHRRECGGPDAGEAEEWALPDLAARAVFLGYSSRKRHVRLRSGYRHG